MIIVQEGMESLVILMKQFVTSFTLVLMEITLKRSVRV